MLRPALKVAEACLITLGTLIFVASEGNLRAQELPQVAPATIAPQSSDLQLEVFINGLSSKLIATFHQGPSGELSVDPSELKDIGLLPSKEAEKSDGMIDIARLPSVTFRYDAAAQTIYFTVAMAAQAQRVIDAGAQPEAETRKKAQSSVGALVNYTLYTSTGGRNWRELGTLQGVSGAFEGRLFSPLGVLSSSQIISFSPNDNSYGYTRLDTDWAYQDEQHLLSYRAGDIITGGLSWTRPTRLGGIQIQRSFDLRPDLVTMPLPQLSGSAAVPSTVEVYIDNTRRLSSDVPSGPFAITNLPVVTGDGTARMVVRDALGRETVTETPFYASASLLAPGLLDFSAETGFARNFYGTESFGYDGQIVGSALLRYGVSSNLTVEAHAEGGASLLNGGLGTVFNLDNYGVASLAGAMSAYGGSTGYQLSASVETDLWGVRLYARTQRSFGDYNDIASVSDANSLAGDVSRFNARPPRVLDQISISAPLKFDPTTLNLSFTQLQTAGGQNSRIVGMTANRSIGRRGNIFMTAYKDLSNADSYGFFAGLSWSFSNDISASTGVSSDQNGLSVATDLVKSERQEIGSYGWRLHDVEGSNPVRDASLSYRASFGRLQGDVAQYGDSTQASGQIDGAAVLAGGGVFLTNRIDDAFAVVDAGAPDVAVEVENRPAGKTNGSGRLLVPGLRSYDNNRISIDPTNLPLDAKIDSTSEIVVPRGKSGAVVSFGVKADSRAELVTLRTEDGKLVETGSAGTIEGTGNSFVVGYDGQAYVGGLGAAKSRLVVERPDGSRCQADVARAAKGTAEQEATCRAMQ